MIEQKREDKKEYKREHKNGQTLNLSLKYRKNELLNQILESERQKEASIILQALDYLVAQRVV